MYHFIEFSVNWLLQVVFTVHKGRSSDYSKLDFIDSSFSGLNFILLKFISLFHFKASVALMAPAFSRTEFIWLLVSSASQKISSPFFWVNGMPIPFGLLVSLFALFMPIFFYPCIRDFDFLSLSRIEHRAGFTSAIFEKLT